MEGRSQAINILVQWEVSEERRCSLQLALAFKEDK